MMSISIQLRTKFEKKLDLLSLYYNLDLQQPLKYHQITLNDGNNIIPLQLGGFF